MVEIDYLATKTTSITPCLRAIGVLGALNRVALGSTGGGGLRGRRWRHEMSGLENRSEIRVLKERN